MRSLESISAGGVDWTNCVSSFAEVFASETRETSSAGCGKLSVRSGITTLLLVSEFWREGVRRQVLDRLPWTSVNLVVYRLKRGPTTHTFELL